MNAMCSELLKKSGEFIYLTAAIPEIEHQVAQEAHMTVLYVDRGAQPSSVPCNVIGEDDGSH